MTAGLVLISAGIARQENDEFGEPKALVQLPIPNQARVRTGPCENSGPEPISTQACSSSPPPPILESGSMWELGFGTPRA